MTLLIFMLHCNIISKLINLTVVMVCYHCLIKLSVNYDWLWFITKFHWKSASKNEPNLFFQGMVNWPYSERSPWWWFLAGCHAYMSCFTAARLIQTGVYVISFIYKNKAAKQKRTRFIYNTCFSSLLHKSLTMFKR